MNADSILKKLDEVDDLPTLPNIAMEVNSMLQDYETSIQKLSDIIENDQAIVSKILKLVNSAFFGLSSRVSTIPHAVVLLGFNTIRNAVLSVSVIGAFSGKEFIEGFNISDFWKHSISVAVTSKYLARQTHLHSSDNCFIGGLLHDIGKLVFVQYFPDLFKKVWLRVREDNLSFYDAEKKETPVNHIIIGTYLAKRWKLPAILIDAIQHHHVVQNNAPNPELHMIVHAADIIVNEWGDGTKERIDISKIDPDAKNAMGPLLDDLSDWFPEVLEEIQSACRFFLEDRR